MPYQPKVDFRHIESIISHSPTETSTSRSELANELLECSDYVELQHFVSQKNDQCWKEAKEMMAAKGFSRRQMMQLFGNQTTWSSTLLKSPVFKLQLGSWLQNCTRKPEIVAKYLKLDEELKTAQRRCEYTGIQRQVLELAFAANQFPKFDERKPLLDLINAINPVSDTTPIRDDTHVLTWFQNRRQRERMENRCASIASSSNSSARSTPNSIDSGYSSTGTIFEALLNIS